MIPGFHPGYLLRCRGGRTKAVEFDWLVTQCDSQVQGPSKRGLRLLLKACRQLCHAVGRILMTEILHCTRLVLNVFGL